MGLEQIHQPLRRNMKDRGNVAVTVLLVVLGVILVVAFTIGAYKLSWWVEEDTTNRQAEINDKSYNRQLAIVDQIQDDVAEVQQGGLPEGQVKAIVDQICQNADRLTGRVALGPNAERFVQRECYNQ